MSRSRVPRGSKDDGTSDSSQTSDLPIDQGINDLISVAESQRKKRTLQLSRKNKKKAKQSSTSKTSKQLEISLGRMRYNHRLKKPIFDKEFGLVKVFVLENDLYADLVRRCAYHVFPDSVNSDGSEFYLSDASGHRIDGDSLMVMESDGSSQMVPWCLSRYFEIRGTKYPSKVKFTIVQKMLPESDDSEVSEDRTKVTSKQPMANPPTKKPAAYPILQRLLNRKNPSAETSWFEPLFGKRVQSLYRDDCSTTKYLTQLSVLGYHVDDREMRNSVEDEVAEKDGAFFLRTENPCNELNIYLHGYRLHKEDGSSDDHDFLDMDDLGMDTEKARRLLGRKECNLVVLAHSVEDVGTLMCAAREYHGLVKYQWYKDKTPMPFASHAVVYVTTPADYSCHVTGPENNLFSSFGKFQVKQADSRSGELVVSGKVEQHQYQPSQSDTVTRSTTENSNSSRPYAEVVNPLTVGNEVTVGSALPECDTQIVTVSAIASGRSSAQVTELKSTGTSGASGVNFQCFCEADFESEANEEVRILEELGRGSFGVVHRAIWRGTSVAAKILPGGHMHGLSDAVSREIAVYGSVQHPNILSLLGVIIQETRLLIITNLVNGKNLHMLIFDSSRVRMSLLTKVQIGFQVAQALRYMHTSNPPTIHLDVKPANVLVEDGTFHTYLSDFGIAQILSTTKVIGTSTLQQGTPAYQSPEHIRAEKGITTSTDVYSFGVLLLEMFGEQLAWKSLTPVQVSYRVAHMNEYLSTDHLEDPRIKELCSLCFRPKESRESITTLQHKLWQIAL